MQRAPLAKLRGVLGRKLSSMIFGSRAHAPKRSFSHPMRPTPCSPAGRGPVRLAVWFAILAVFSLAHAAAAQEFASAAEEKRYRALLAELRCMVCPNQSLADSRAGLAGDLREITLELLRKGNTDNEIRDYLASRYSDFILYDPPFKVATALLWLGPVLLLATALALVRAVVLSASRSGNKRAG